MSVPASEAVRLVVQEVGHLERLVLDLIEMSRFDARTASLLVDDVDVDAVVRACLARRGWSDRVAMDVPRGLRLRLDRRRLDVVIANLVGNAVRYGRPPVEVVARVEAGQLLLRVSDHGTGLTPQELPHVFERFYKADAARTRSPGSGLGLAIARENVRLHGGTVTAANRPTGGAVFTVLIPQSAPGSVGPAAAHDAPVVTAATAPAP